ncbi:MAG: SNF2-related protein [Gammaproteobacteria bacterium]
MTQITVAQGKIYIRTPFQNKDRCKAINDARWSPTNKCWYYPATPATARAIMTGFNGQQVKSDEAFQELFAESEITRHINKARDFGFLSGLPEPRSKTKSWDHQTKAFHFCKDKSATMLAFEMRCGKSKTAIDLAVHWDARLVLVTCPLSVLPVWFSEFGTHAAEDYRVLLLSKGSTKNRARELGQFVDLCRTAKCRGAVVVNHEASWREDMAKVILHADFDLLIVDESHRAKDRRGKFSGFLNKLAAQVPHVLALTGTPMPHSPMDIFAQYRFLDPGIFGTSFFKFRNRFAVMGGWQDKQIVGYQNQELLSELFNSIAYRVKQRDAIDLPPEADIERYCELSPEGRRVYEELKRNFVAEVKGGIVTASNAMVKILRFQQVTSGHVKLEDGKTILIDGGETPPKLKLLKEVIDDESARSRSETRPLHVVVFCRFRRDLDEIKRLCQSEGKYQYGEISGSRKDLTEQAKMPSWCEVMGVQVQAGGMGIDLSRAATCIFYSTGLALGDYEQCKSRVKSHASAAKITYIHLLARETYDETILKALTQRKNVVEYVMQLAKGT